MKTLSIVIPCYNEGEKLITNVGKVKEYLDTQLTECIYEIVCVNDGSTDNKTSELFKTTKIDKVKFISYDKNHGKGFAVKTGFENSNNDILLFMDADLSVDLSAIKTIMENTDKADILIGSRHHKDTVIPIPQPTIRQFIGRACIFITNFLTHIGVKDTQCGFKAFKKDVAKKIIQKQQIERWAFDVEYLYVAKLNKISILEIPVIWSDDSDSRVSPIKSSISFFKELLKIRSNKKIYKNF